MCNSFKKLFFSLVTKSSAWARKSPSNAGKFSTGWEDLNPLLSIPGEFGRWDFREGYFGGDSRAAVSPCSALTPHSAAPHSCANTQSRCPKADGSNSQWRQQENEIISHLRGFILQGIHSGLGRVMCLSIMLVPLLDSLLQGSRNPLPSLPTILTAHSSPKSFLKS